MSKQLDFFAEKQRYRYWDILDEMPDGWVIDKTAGSPAPRTVFITNGKSPISGKQKRALLRVEPFNKKRDVEDVDYIEILKQKAIDDKPVEFPAKTVNQLARAKFKEQLLKEIMFDLMVCEVEKWDKREYINELKDLINSIDVDKTKWK